MQNKWMTREGFEKSGYLGVCWVAVLDDTYLCIYNGQYYIDAEDHEATCITSHIKAVMPIEKPEYPKEVG